MFRKRNFHVIFLILCTWHTVTGRKNINDESKDEACKLPDRCRKGSVHDAKNLYAREFVYLNDTNGIICDVKDQSSRFDQFDVELAQAFNISSCINKISILNIFDFRFPSNMNLKLDEKFNLKGIIEFQSILWLDFTLHLINIGGFDVDLNVTVPEITDINIEIIRAKVEFYAKGSLVKSCQDLMTTFDLTWSPSTIFQVQSVDPFTTLVFLNCQFKKPLCPLLFKNANIYQINIWGMSDYFYKRNTITFTNDKFGYAYDLNSNITRLYFFKCENLSFDSKLLNLYVFKYLTEIVTENNVKLIENELFGRFERVVYFHIKASYFRKLVHKQGIEWIKSKNRGLRVNLTDPKELAKHQDKIFRVGIKYFWGTSYSDMYPEADFCLYKDFPFHQLVVFVFFKNNFLTTLNSSQKMIPTCTSRWLSQYYRNIQDVTRNYLKYHIKNTIEDESKILNTCDFKKLLENCNKNNFHSKNIWDMSDTKLLTKYIQVFLASSSSAISLFGIISNSMLVYIILTKNNIDLFKGLKQYPYLCVLSVFNIITLFIQLLSWLSDCNKTFDVFCPDTRRLLFFQYFKIIFKETLVVTLQFMSNFAYMKFSFNRIALIGKNHAKIVEKLAKIKFKKYIIVSVIVSAIFSIVKGFKYKVNYDLADRSYPFSIEEDLGIIHLLARDVYFGANLISDFLNYFVFVLINLSIDIYMLKRLRQTLNEKLKRFAVLVDMKQFEKELEMRESMNNAIRMVVVNSSLNLLFKLPQTLIPIENVVERIYYESKYYKCQKFNDCKLGFRVFSHNLRDSNIYYFVSDLCGWLLIILISIQLFVYSKFDRNIKLGLDRLLNFSTEKKNKNTNNKKNINQRRDSLL